MNSRPFNIFIVEDNDWYRKLLEHNLSLDPDLTVRSFATGKELMAALKDGPDVITLDYRLPDINGGKLLKSIKEFNEEIEVIVISEQEDIETAVELLKAGAYDYLVKSKDIREKLFNSIKNIRKKVRLIRRIDNLEKELGKRYSFENTMIGNSRAIRDTFRMISKAVESNITVIITGETGTGKEVTARAIHYNSERKRKPFVAINMAAIPAELVESELFGHEKGAFTGASSRRIGKFEEASGGTLFLDEIAEMNFNLQAKLLRVLQEREITRLGSNTPIGTDCRIIVATSSNLRNEVESKNFREELYYRLMGLPIHLAPLRDREDDIILLAKFFADEFCRENQRPVKKISEEARLKLRRHSWPGNVRELKSAIELAALMSDSDAITAEDISLESTGPAQLEKTGELSLREYNHNIVKHLMQKFNNNTRLVAKQLDIGQTTVYRMLKEMDGDPGIPEHPEDK